MTEVTTVGEKEGLGWDKNQLVGVSESTGLSIFIMELLCWWWSDIFTAGGWMWLLADVQIIL